MPHPPVVFGLCNLPEGEVRSASALASALAMALASLGVVSSAPCGLRLRSADMAMDLGT